MKISYEKNAFNLGEISPELFARGDLERYDMGLALAKNVFVNYHGGVMNRPGMEFCDYIAHDDQNIRIIPFQYAPNVANTYLVIFGHNYIRFMQDGAYVTRDARTVTDITQSLMPIVTCAAHGYSTGDWVRITGANGMPQVNWQIFQIEVLDSNRFYIFLPYDSYSTEDFPAFSGTAQVSRVYTVTSPYPSSALPQLKYHQYRETIRLTHEAYAPHELTRKDHADWSIEPTQFGSTAQAPGFIIASPSETGDSGVAFAVTSVNTAGEESRLSWPTIIRNTNNYAVVEGSVALYWDPVPGAVRYNVYRSTIVPDGNDVNTAVAMGYLGTTYGPLFTDPNIIPDFTVTPPEAYNPFANGAIYRIDVLDGGSDYDGVINLTMSGGGTGFEGQLVIDNNVITGVIIRNPGYGYSNPTLTAVGAGGGQGSGSGAQFQVFATPLNGNFPSVSTVFQQRQIYAASRNQPLTIWGSRPRNFNNFDTSRIVTAADSYEFDVESESATPIKHLLPMRSGLVIFSNAGIWNLTAGEQAAVSADNALADPQSFQGCGELRPLTMDADILYVGAKSTTFRLLSYNDIYKVYSGRDVSILSEHLFSYNNFATSWAYADAPHHLIHITRSDGRIVTLCAVNEHNVFGWTWYETQGMVDEVAVLQEGQIDRTYCVVSRNGRKYIERFALREQPHIEFMNFLDSSLELGHNYPNATLHIAVPVKQDNWEESIVSRSTGSFHPNDVGSILRASGGKGEVIEYINPSRLRVRWARLPSNTIPGTNQPRQAIPGDWTLDKPVTSVYGLHHLEGQTVTALADGNVVEGLHVVDGIVNLPQPATQVIIGLPYQSSIKTLPPQSDGAGISNKIKRVISANVRVVESRGLKVGDDFDHLEEIPEREYTLMGEPIDGKSGIRGAVIRARQNKDGQCMVVQDYPLPMAVTGLYLDLEMED